LPEGAPGDRFGSIEEEEHKPMDDPKYEPPEVEETASDEATVVTAAGMTVTDDGQPF
jgi:hypothetical protein